MNRFTRTVTSLSLLGLSLTIAGCGPAIDPETAAAEGRAMAPVRVATPGPARLVGQAFAEVPLDPLQRRAVEALAADTAARHRAVATAMRGASQALADQIEAGRLDRSVMRAHVDAIAHAWEVSQPHDRATVGRLHGLLDIEQRQILADAVEEEVDRVRDRRPIFAKWASWKEELALSEAQEDAIADAVRARVKIPWWEHTGWVHHQRRERLDEVLDAFVEEGFDLDETAPPLDAHATVAERAGRVLDVVEAALPHLTPAQRGIAARRIRARGDEDLP